MKNCPLLKILLFLASFFSFSLLASPALAAPTLEITSIPSFALLDQSFIINTKLSNLDAGFVYFVKALGGADWQKVKTWNETTTSWLAWNAPWTSMPSLVAIDGENNFSITAKFTAEAPLGFNPLKIRIRKQDTSTNYDSPEVQIEILSVPPTATLTPTPTEEPTPTLTPTPTETPTPTPTPTTPPTPTPTETFLTPTPTPTCPTCHYHRPLKNFFLFLKCLLTQLKYHSSSCPLP